MTTTIRTTMGPREWATLVVLSMLWGGSFFFVEIVVTALPPLTIVLVRVSLAALTLWGVALAMGLGPPRAPGVWAALLAMGAMNNVVPFTLIVWGQTHIASGLAAILNATTPLFTVIVAGALLEDEPMTPRKLAGVAAGFTGVVLMIGPAALGEVGADVLAQLAVLGGALSYALSGVFGRRFRALGVHPVTTAAGQVTAAALILAPIAFVVDRPLGLAMPGAGVWAAMVALAVLSTALAYILYFRLLATAGATNLLLVTFLIPVSAILLGVLVLGETLEAIHFAGMGCIGLGLSVIDGRVWRRLWAMRSASPG